MLRVLFMGTPAFAVPALEAVSVDHQLVAVVTQPDRPRGRGQRPASSAVKRWAERQGLPVEQPETLRRAEIHRRLAAYAPDLIIVVAYGLILPASVLAVPPRGCINLHASLLPRHRGAAPVAWAILRGDDETGVTTMLMDEGLDTGPVLMQSREPIALQDTTPVLAERLAVRGAELLARTLCLWEAGELTPQPQDHEQATFAPRFRKEDGCVDWQQPALAIARQVRALQPWPGTYTFAGRKRLQLWSAEPGARMEGPVSRAGTVACASAEGVWVSCGDGELLRITELQLAGGKRQVVGAFLRGHSLAAGDLLGASAGPRQ